MKTVTYFVNGYILWSFLGSVIRPTSAQEQYCRTHNEQTGTCVIIHDCPALIRIFHGPKPISQSSLELLRKSQCGFEGSNPKVCCQTSGLGEITTVLDIMAPTVSSIEAIPNPPNVVGHPNLRLLSDDICGPVTQPKIFGGNKTGVLDYPWMALIAYAVDGRKEFRCGGSIINKRYIMTAAHCVTQLPPDLSLLGVRVGEHDLRTERDCDRDEDGQEIVCSERYQDFGIESFQFHSNYIPPNLQNDIALIRLDADIDFRPLNVKPICLPIGTAATLRSKKVTVTGWGATESGPRSQDLLRVIISPVPNEECADVYKKNAEIWYKQMCAGGQDGKDSCQGDSGGPLQAPAIYNSNARYVQYGIVSFGPRNCGIERFPGVYTNVAYYVDWILSHITA